MPHLSNTESYSQSLTKDITNMHHGCIQWYNRNDILKIWGPSSQLRFESFTPQFTNTVLRMYYMLLYRFLQEGRYTTLLTYTRCKNQISLHRNLDKNINGKCFTFYISHLCKNPPKGCMSKASTTRRFPSTLMSVILSFCRKKD